MASLIELIPTEGLFVFVFALLPVMITVYLHGYENVSIREWGAFALIILGGVLVYGASKIMSSVEMQTLLWPLLVVMGLGFLLYREVLVDKGEWDESSIERGGASYDDD